jgi:hypothetical protein
MIPHLLGIGSILLLMGLTVYAHESFFSPLQQFNSTERGEKGLCLTNEVRERRTLVLERRRTGNRKDCL